MKAAHTDSIKSKHKKYKIIEKKLHTLSHTLLR